jgi:hypothetical protein
MAPSKLLGQCVAIFRTNGHLYHLADSPRTLAVHLRTLRMAGDHAVQVVGRLNGIRYHGVALIENLLAVQPVVAPGPAAGPGAGLGPPSPL